MTIAGKNAAVRALVAIAAVLLLLAACGGGSKRLSKAEYEHELQAQGKNLNAALRDLSDSNSKQDFKNGVVHIENALDDAANKFDDITPPQDVEAANERLAGAFHDLSDDFERVKAAADKGPQAARAEGSKVSHGRASQQADNAIKEIQRRGYDVGQLGS